MRNKKVDMGVCGGYFCKVVGCYVLLCLIALIIYTLVCIGFGVTETSDKLILLIGLFTWTAAMIVPIAAFFAITDWRDQQKFLDIYQRTSKLLETYTMAQVTADSFFRILNLGVGVATNDSYEEYYGNFEVRRRQDETYFNKNIYYKHQKEFLDLTKKMKELLNLFQAQNKMFCLITHDEELIELVESFDYIILGGIKQFEDNKDDAYFDMYVGYLMDDLKKVFLGGTYAYVEHLKIYLDPTNSNLD